MRGGGGQARHVAARGHHTLRDARAMRDVRRRDGQCAGRAGDSDASVHGPPAVVFLVRVAASRAHRLPRLGPRIRRLVERDRLREPLGELGLETLPFLAAISMSARLNLHASVHLAANDDVGRERLCRDLNRPAFSRARLRLRRDGNVSLRMKKSRPGDRTRDEAHRDVGRRARQQRAGLRMTPATAARPSSWTSSRVSRPLR